MNVMMREGGERPISVVRQQKIHHHDFIHSLHESSPSLCIDDVGKHLCKPPTPGRSHMLGEPPHPARIVASCRASDLPSGSATFLCHVDLLAGLVHSQGPFLPTTLCHVHLYGRFLHLGAPFLPTTFCHVDLVGRWSRAPFTVPPFATLNY